MNINDFKKSLEQKLIEQQSILESAKDDAETIRRPHCKDLWEIAEESERAVIIDNTLINSQQNIKTIESALSKIDGNKYGFCEQCDTDISPERLKTVPEVAFCHDCQNTIDNEAFR